MSTKQTAESFWARVDRASGPNACWPFVGARNNSGYGTVSWDGKVFTAHRLAAWLLGLVKYASAPRNRKGSGFILHTCDNPLCCNPQHFEIGKYRKNQVDCYARGRRTQLKGAQHANAKLSTEQVANIRAAYATGAYRQIDLAIAHGVSQRAISLVVRGETYK